MEPKSLICFVDKVQFTVSKNVSVQFIDVANSNCSVEIKEQRTVAFNYKDCDSKIIYVVNHITNY